MRRKDFDNAFNNKSPEPSPDTPYNKYTIDDVRRLACEEKKIAREIMYEYVEKYSELLNEALTKTVSVEYSTAAGNTFSRGYYHRGDALDMLITNVGRGKLLKKPPKPTSKNRYYRFMFDKRHVLICSELTEMKCDYYHEFIIRRGNREFGLNFSDTLSPKFPTVNMAVFNNDSFDENDLRITYKYYNREIEELCLYDYDDSGRRISASIVLNNVESIFADIIKLYYEYNEEGILIGSRDTDGYFHSVKGRYARKYTTSVKLADEMEKILRNWVDIPEDVYVISIYYELNETDETAKFYIGFNTEESVKFSEKLLSDPLDARWNYACWLQNDKPLFGDDEIFYVRYIMSGGAQRLLVNAVKALRKRGVIKEVFKKDLPVIIHYLEYSPEDAQYNLDANGKKLLPKDFIDFCGGLF